MSEMFQTTARNIGFHINNVYEEGELETNSTRKDYFLTASDGKNYKTKHYNLDVIISVGYRVKSHIETKLNLKGS